MAHDAIAQQESAPPPIRQRFVDVKGRRVHYLRSGEGPPLVMAHPTPGSAWSMVAPMRMFTDRYTVFAFDTPGMGLSDPLPLEKPTINDLANAMADTMRVLNFPRAFAYGTATGAAMALELARAHPDLLCGIILNAGVPLFRPEEAARFQEEYTSDIVIDDLGGHYTSTWTHFRDTGNWLPWYRRIPEALTGMGVMSPKEINDMMIVIFRGRNYYRRIVKAVVATGPHSARSLEESQVPAIIVHSVPSHVPFLDITRAEPLKPLHRTVVVENNFADRVAAIRVAALELADANSIAPEDRDAPQSCDIIEKHYLDLGQGQMFVRHCGALDRRKLILIHDCPGSALPLEPLMLALTKDFDVYAPDLPGCGESDPLSGDAPTLADYAGALGMLVDAYDLTGAVVYGVGFGAVYAAALTGVERARVSSLLLHSPIAPGEEQRGDLRANYAPPVTLDPTGSHWYRTWLMLRDSQLFWPWYNGTSAGVRYVAADFGADHLHAWNFELQKQYASYHHAINAALDQPFDVAALARMMPVRIAFDPVHPFAAFEAEVQARCPSVELTPLSSDPFKVAEAILLLPGRQT